jgi:hypothetical protein
MILDLADSQHMPRRLMLGAIASALPLWVLAWLSLAGGRLITPAFAVTAALAYGAVTLSFLGGVRAGVALGPYGERRHRRELTLSALAPLAGFLAVFTPPAIGVSLLLACFLLSALLDQAGAEMGRLPAWFSRLRLILTGLAVVPLLAILGRLVLTAMP